MDSKTNAAPSFTVSLRGYDRMEVDEYLDSLAEALGQVEQAEVRCRGLQAHIDRLNARIADLEQRISSETPRSGAVLGERIAILLRSAEETAADTVNRAEVQAAELLDKAREEVAQAEDQARGAICRGEEQARRTEAEARAEAAEIIAEAEARASARTRQIEQWAEQVISHTRSEEARMLKEQHDKKQEGLSEIRALVDTRDEVAANLTELRDVLGRALGLISDPVELPVELEEEQVPVDEAQPAADHHAPDHLDHPEQLDQPEQIGQPEEPSAELGDHIDMDDDFEESVRVLHTPSGVEDEAELVDEAEARDEEAETEDADDEMPWPAAFEPTDQPAESSLVDLTGEMEIPARLDADDESDEFESKFDAWVNGPTGEPQHFRRL